ncbi:MAG TPA: endonuclease/exonuclease/phosphatase family protein [Albitalea sp.]|nr:endonuclease/exonuclease/phosphatase family protein [Albitalea sp.]
MTKNPAAVGFRILTVNTHKGFTAFNRKFILHELREAVHAVGADIVFLQEVLGSHALHATRVPNWPSSSHYEFLADTMWHDFAYGRNAVYPHGDHGNAVLSKFPILRHENRDVSVNGHEERGLLHCVCRLPERDAGNAELHLVCVHLGLLESHRQQQIELLCHMIRDELPPDAPLVIAGDFNDWRLRGHAQIEGCAGVREVFVHARGRAAKTFPARFPLLQLDRIYVRNAAVHRPFVLPRRPWSHLSDHAPLAAEVVV